MNDTLAYSSITDLRRLIARGELSAEGLTTAAVDRIRERDRQLNAVVYLDREAALAQARALDRLPADRRGPLHGIPVAIKDVTETADMPTTYGSEAFAGYEPGFDAAIVGLLRAAGAVILCKTNTPELACEPVTRGDLHGETRNPWAPDRSPGGSSGGAGAGLAAGMFPLAQGTDAGGSIRIPASCCGTVGIKPSRGLVTMDPLGHGAWGGLLHNGPLARSVRDLAIALDVMATPCRPGGAPTALWGTRFEAACDAQLPPLRMAYSDSVPGGRVDAEVGASLAEAVDVFRSLGLEMVEASPDFTGFVEPFMTLANAAFAGMGSDMSDQQLGLIGHKCLALMKRGWEISGAELYVASLTAHRLASEALTFWDDFDLWLTPTVPTVPPLLAEFPSTEEHEQKWAEYGYWETFTSPANLTGQPAMSLPAAAGRESGLPIGIQLTGRPGADALIFTVAAAYELAAGWADRRPPDRSE
jgi:amidase/aspartyl-tRNA(Asn)/glutamyl-tRNA(Gln) amidotransferase subunit A